VNLRRGRRPRPDASSEALKLAPPSDDIIRGLASDLVEERRHSKLLESEVRRLKAELAAAQRDAS